MAGPNRSHSPPLPPNASYNHPVIALNILPSSNLFVAGSKLTGMLDVVCKEKNSVALGQLAIEFFAIEELKLLDHSAQSSIHGPHKCIFQGPALPPSNAVVTSEAPVGGHYYTALRGRTKFPFSFPLPSKLPSSTDFDGKARVSYALKATCQVLTIESRQNVLVTKSRTIRIVEKMLDWTDSKYHETVEMRGELREASGSGAGVWAEVKIDKMLHYNRNSSMPDDGLIRAQLSVKNNSRRTLSGGVNAKICRKLVLPNDPPSLNDASRIQIVRNCTFGGIDYEFPSISNQAKTVKLVCQLPSSSPDDPENADKNIFCISTRGMKLFSIDMFLRVELELGALSNDLVVDLPIYVTHPSSLPKELLVRNTPRTIEHVPSSNPLSFSHLTEPQASGRISRNTSRSSSPHPPSLQPGNISRSASPRLSLNTGEDWGMGPSCPSSPAQSARFSPLPSPRHSPLPSARFSSPLPFSPSSATPNNHFSVPRNVPTAPFASPSVVSWPSTQPTPHPSDQYTSAGFSPHPQQFNKCPYPPESQPIFSPPITPWRRQTTSAPSPFDPNPIGVSSMPQPGYHAISQANDSVLPMPPHSTSYPQQPFNPPACHGPDAGNAIQSPWRIRHHSLPATPAPSQNQLRNSVNQYYGEDRAQNSPTPSPMLTNSRRISEPISNQPVIYPHPNSGGLVVRKRALPTPPQRCQVTESPSDDDPHYQNGSNTTQDHQQQPVPLSNEQQHLNPYARLETIGEVGESQHGTLNATQAPRDVLDSLATCTDSEESVEDDVRHPRRWQPTRVVSQPRGMRPRRSDGSDSVQALEDMVSKADERRSAGEAHARDSACDQTATLSQQPVYDDPSPSNQQRDNYSTVSSRSNRNSLSPHPHCSSQPTHPTGLANLVHFLKRATSTDPPRASSANESLSHEKKLSAENHADVTFSSQPSDDNLARTSTPSISASALRIKSTRISYGEIDAVPCPSHAHKPSLESDNSSTSNINKSDWKPPSTLVDSSTQVSRTSIVEQIDLCDDHSEEGGPGRESIAPDALFPQFQSEHNTPSVNGQRESTPDQPPPSTKSLANAASPTRLPTAPILIPTDCPLVKKKSSKPSRKTSQPVKKIPELDSPSRDETASASPSRPPLGDIKPNTSPLLQKTIVERLRSQHGPVIHKSSHEQRENGKDRTSFRISKSDDLNQTAERDQSKFDLVDKKNASNKVIQAPSSLPQSFFKPASIQNKQLPILPSSSQSDQTGLPLPSVPRLSAIPKSENPLSLQGSSCYTSSSRSIPHRPLPISPNANPNPVSTFESAAVSDPQQLKPAQVPISYDVNLPTRALFSSMPLKTSPKQTPLEPAPSSQPNRASGHLKTNSLSASSSSPTSPTNLSRKSRIKRQVSSTNTTHEHLGIPNVGTERGTGDGGVLTFRRIPGEWNEDESNEIEAQLMEALKETNLAVQKATSKRLSTPQFSKSPTLNRTLIFSKLSATSEDAPSKRSSRIDRDRFRASMSIVESPGSRSGGSYDRPLSQELASSRDVTERSSSLHTDQTLPSAAFDEDTPIRLTSGEYKSMRGGRGGRVSSVVGQWAKLTSADDGTGTLTGRKYGDSLPGGKDKNVLEEMTIPAPSNISTRGISIKPKKLEHTSSYSITGFLSRNSSLASHSSKPFTSSMTGAVTGATIKPSMNQDRRTLIKDDYMKKMDESKSRVVEPINSPMNTPRKSLPQPVVVSSKTETNSSGIEEGKKESKGYRNLANRLSGVIPPPPPPSNNNMVKCASSSSSTSSFSSLTSSSLNQPNHPNSSDIDLHLGNKKLLNTTTTTRSSHHLVNNNRTGIIGGAPQRNKLLPSSNSNSSPVISPGFPVATAISDLVKRWET